MPGQKLCDRRFTPSAFRGSALAIAIAAAAVVVDPMPAGAAETLGPSTWILVAPDTNSRAWANGNNWDTAPDHPSGVGAVAIINNDPNRNRNFSFTPSGTGSDPVSPAPGQITFGSLTVNNSSAFTNNFTSGSNSVFLDAAGDGPAEIRLLGNATSSAVPNTLAAIWVLTDSLKLTVDKTSSTSSVADVSVTGPMSGAGGLIKAGFGTAVITNGSAVTKTYTGATVIEQGRLRIGTMTGSTVSGVARPMQATASVAVHSGAQLDLGPNVSTILFGASSATPININGSGIEPGTPLGGTFGFSGAIRTGVTITLQNNIVVQSNDAAITAHGASTVLTLNGVISGGNRLRIGAFGNAPDQGTVKVTAANTHTGGTLISQGTLLVEGANATLGSGDVYVDGESWLGPNPTIKGLAAGRLSIASGVLDAIADSATLTLTGDTATFGGVGDAAPGGFATLGAGIDEVIGGLVLGGVTHTAIGSYGSSSSGADYQSDAYFAGTGVVRLVPEPASLALLGLGGIALLARRRRSV